MKDLRQLHLLGATGTARIEKYDGRDHLVVPVVALMEGVIHAVNAATPEFVSAATIEKAAPTWNGRPVTLGHPVKGGKQCSANEPHVRAEHMIGTIFNSRVEGKKLLCEAWIDQERAKKLHPEMYARLLDNKTEEVSVGAFVVTDDKAGEHGGKPFKATWLETTGDHLAFLPGGRGACSVAMGCGTHRAAMHLVTAEGLEIRSLEEHALDLPACTTFTTLAGQSLDERIQAVNEAIGKKWNANNGQITQPNSYAYSKQVFDSSVIVQVDAKMYACPYDVAEDGTVTLGDPTEVKQTYIAAKSKMEDCPTCNGAGNVDGNPCEACNGSGEIRAAAGARHSAADVGLIQAVHDHAMSLGAVCDRGNYKLLGGPGSGWTTENGHVPGSQGGSTGQKLEKSGYKALKVGDKIPHVGVKGIDTVRDHTLYVKTFSTEKEANRAQDEFQFYEHPGAVSSSVTGPQKSNDFFPGWHHEVEVKHTDAQQKLKGMAAAAEPQLKAACRCEGESTMDKKAKAELIAALVADKHSGFKEDDVAFLETAPDARLDGFKAAAEANKAAAEKAEKAENDLRAAQAKLTVIEGKLKAAEAAPTQEEWLAKAPAGIKTLLDRQAAQEAEQRDELIKNLKGVGANTEDELKAMPTAQLQTLAQYAKVKVVDFSGRGIALERAAQAADDEDFTPPNPYEAPIKALQGAAKVN